MFFLSVFKFNNMIQDSVETTTMSIFESPFFPEQLTFSDVLGVVSVILAVISIILTIVIYLLSNETSEKLAEEVARRAFEKKYNEAERANEKSVKIYRNVNLNKNQYKVVKKLINQLIKKAKKNSLSEPWLHAASFPIQLKDEFTEEETVQLMYEWKDKKLISWNGALENSTKVFILRGDLIIEDIDSR